MALTMVSSASAAECDNEAIRQAQISAALPGGSVYLPDCMALEMVSSPEKRLQVAKEPTFSEDGERIKFRSAAALAGTPGLQSLLDNYVASRGSAGWTVAPTSPPASTGIVAGMEEKGGPYGFASDLRRWILLGSRQEQSAVGIGQFFLGGLDNSLTSLSPVLVPIDNSGVSRVNVDTVEAESTGSSADLSTTVFHPKLASTHYFPSDPFSALPTGVAEDGKDQSNYVASLHGAASVELLSRDSTGVVYGGRCGTHLGGGLGGNRGTGGLNQGAISADGERIYFSTRPAQPEGASCNILNPLRIFERIQTPMGSGISELVPGEPASPGDDLYQGASLDGSKVFFTTTRSLTLKDKDSGVSCSDQIGSSIGCDLYLYDASRPVGDRLVDISAGEASDPTPGEGADVLSAITAISSDGSHAYFVAQGVLTADPNSLGKSAALGEANLYLYESGDANPAGNIVFIGTLADEDAGGLWGVEQSFVNDAYAVPLAADVSGQGSDGHILVFASRSALSDDDKDGGLLDVYRFNADTNELVWISQAVGGIESSTSDVSVGTNEAAPNANFAEQGRWVSEDGETIGFSTASPLVPEDEDGEVNPYIWKSGQLARLPSATNELLTERNPVLSHSGDQVGFSTTDSLLPQDGDTVMDVYIARVGGGFSAPELPTPCDPLQEGSCRNLVPVPVEPQGAGSDVFVGAGNPKARSVCKKGYVRKKGKCVKKAKAKRQKQAGKKRGGKR